MKTGYTGWIFPKSWFYGFPFYKGGNLVIRTAPPASGNAPPFFGNWEDQTPQLWEEVTPVLWEAWGL